MPGTSGGVPDPDDRRGALALSDAGGQGRVVWVGLASAIVGQLIIAAAEMIWPGNRDLGDVLFSVSPIPPGPAWSPPAWRFIPLVLPLCRQRISGGLSVEARRMSG